MSEKKKKFPKLKKSLKKFLADESGKITKKDALGLAAGAVLLSGVEEVGAGYYVDNHQYCTNVSVNHASGIVNGHYSSTPNYSGGNLAGHANLKHSSHSSHGSHGSHGSRW